MVAPTPVESTTVDLSAAEPVAVTPDVIVAAPEVAAELASEIAAPQYGVGLPLFDAQPLSVESTRADNDDAPKA